jgi:hypothetical protein
MIIIGRYLFFFILSLGWLQEQTSASNDCRQTIQELVGETTQEDWNQLPPSLTSIGASNLGLLFGVEASRGLMGWTAAFSHGFWVNTAIDPIITILSHIVATNPPQVLTRFLSGKGTYIRRASMNTVLNTLVVLALWQTAAALHPEIQVTSAEAAGATGLCAAYYFCIQFVKNKLFVELPRRFDARVLSQMKERLGEPLTQLVEQAAARGEQIAIDRSQVEALFVAALEAATLRIRFEERVVSHPQLMAIDSIAHSVRKIQSSQDLNKQMKWRKKLLFEALSVQGLLSLDEKLSLFDLGSPFSREQSLEVVELLKARSWRNQTLVWMASIGDQSIGVILAGGILLRGLTEWAMTPGNPSFWSYFFGGP